MLRHVCSSSKVRNELELLRAGKSCTGVSDPTNRGFPFVPEKFDLSSKKIENDEQEACEEELSLILTFRKKSSTLVLRVTKILLGFLFFLFFLCTFKLYSFMYLLTE